MNRKRPVDLGSNPSAPTTDECTIFGYRNIEFFPHSVTSALSPKRIMLPNPLLERRIFLFRRKADLNSFSHFLPVIFSPFMLLPPLQVEKNPGPAGLSISRISPPAHRWKLSVCRSACWLWRSGPDAPVSFWGPHWHGAALLLQSA